MDSKESLGNDDETARWMRVLDVSNFMAGPFCATQLAEFGAEVIKVELPGVGDPLRKFGTPTESGDTLCWLSEARNKKSVTLDLRKPEGAALLKRLVVKSDILIENFQTGTMEGRGRCLGGSALDQSRTRHGPNYRIRSNRTECAPARLRAYSERLRWFVFSRGRS